MIDGIGTQPIMRTMYPQYNEAAATTQPNIPVGDKVPATPEKHASRETDLKERELKKQGVIECQTCSNREYVDVSNDPGVSFKSPTKISPNQAAAAVSSHEGEHVTNEQARAKEEGREVLSQTVVLHSDICPECGRAYISGGTTRTVTGSKKSSQINTNPRGQNVDLTT